MPGSKEIRNKIRSIKSTQKITSAMEMVAASKMRKAQDRMHRSRPYAERIHNIVGHLANAHPEFCHAYMSKRTSQRIGVIIISSDRGLCGGLNTNLFKTTLKTLREWEKEGVALELCTIGSKASQFFKRVGGNIVSQATHLGDAPSVEALIGVIKVMLDSYEKEHIDRLVLIYNEFVNTMTQQPKIAQLLPIVPAQDERLQHHWDYIYEPDSEEVLDMLLTRYVESLVYQAVVENIACEQAARMVAMKSASDNAGNLIDELQLVYNKARQAAITQEISEIVGGAAAV